MTERVVFAMLDGEVSDDGFRWGRSGLGIGDVEEGLVGMKGRREKVECSRYAERTQFLCSSVYHRIL